MKKNRKTFLRKSISITLSLLLVVMMIPFVELPVIAATINETESNNDYASANSFSLNSTISGKMGDSNDKDYFKISPSQNGKITLTISHNYSSNSDIYWNIVMYAYASGTYTEFYNQRIYANSGEINKLASIGAASGTIYYIKISTYYNATAGFTYNLKNEFTATNYYEKEINNDYSTATSMSFNQTYGGVMNDSDDLDYFKFSPSQNGKIALNFTHAQSDNSDIYWNISMYAYSSGNYTEFYNQRIYANSGEVNKLASIGAASGTIYYIRISTYYNATTGFDYNIKNSFTTTDYYEKEINNNYGLATPMSFNQTYGGVMNDDDDVDVYNFSPSQDGKISLTFSHDYSSNGDIYWNIVMYAYSSGTYIEFYNQRIYANSGETNKLSPIGASSGTTYYLKIYTYYNATTGFEYSLKNEFTATNYYEKEINKEYSLATPISLGASYGGVMNDDDDIDNYKITVSSTSTPLSFSHDYVNNSDVYWDIKVIDANTYSEKFSTRVYGSDSNGVITTIDQTGTYYIRISTYYNATINYEYSLLVGNPSYTISYNANGGSGAPSSQIKYQNQSLKLSSTTPTRTGYTFLGWSTSSTATSATYSAGGTYTANASATLYAVWKINTYTISYNANGGSGAPSSQTKTYGQSLTLSSTKPTRSGYTFLGWSTSSTATSATYSAGGTYTANASATLYAVWSGNTTYTISYNANGGSGAPSSQTKYQNQDLTLSTTTPTRTGYTFLGWSTSSTATSATYSAGGTYTANASATLYAVWKINTYTISYNANGGSGAPSSQTKTYGQSLTLSSTKPTRSGYTFLGWSTSSTATSATYSAGGTYTANASATLYAVWQSSPTNALIKASSVKGTAGKTVDVTISLSNNPGIVAMTLKVTYNTSVLTLVDVKDAGVLGTNSHKPEKTSPYTLSWANDTATSNYTVNGTIATLTFEIKDGASVGNYPITVTYDYNNYGIYDKDLNKVNFNIENGSVEVIDVIYGDVDGNGIVNNLDRVYLTRYLANWNDYQNIDLNAADVDCNGTVNNLDRVILTRHLANWSAYSELPYSN